MTSRTRFVFPIRLVFPSPHLFHKADKSLVSLTKFVRVFRSRIIAELGLLRIRHPLDKSEGSIDAGQMIKPALAKGLQSVGANTRKQIFSPFQPRLLLSSSTSISPLHFLALICDASLALLPLPAEAHTLTISPCSRRLPQKISKEAAVEHRFQPVTTDQPTVSSISRVSEV